MQQTKTQIEWNTMEIARKNIENTNRIKLIKQRTILIFHLICQKGILQRFFKSIRNIGLLDRAEAKHLLDINICPLYCK